MNYNYTIKEIHKEDVQVGDTIICDDGVMRTVCQNNITRDSFMGILIFGSSYRLGLEKVKKVIFITP